METNVEEYTKDNNEKNEHSAINKKLLKVSITSIICSIVFILLDVLPSSNFKGSIENSMIGIFPLVKLVTHLISIFGIIYIVLFLTRKITLEYSIKKIIYSTLDWVLILPICLCISSIVFKYGLSFTEVSGDSMLPYIHEEEKLVLFYDKTFERDNIVVVNVTKGNYFKVSEDKYYIKRLVGLPGDTISIIQNGDSTDIYINGQLYNQEYYGENSNYKNFKVTNYNEKFGTDMYVDEDNKVLFSYFNENKEITKTYVIPEGYYFILGDNRTNSKDSREIGLVKKQDIIGVIKYRVKGKFILNWGELQ